MNLNDQFEQYGTLMLQPSTIEDAGIGVFCTANIPSGVPVCEYKGDVLNDEEMLLRYAYTMELYGFSKPKALYCINNHFRLESKGKGKQYIDAHPAVSVSPLGYGALINDKHAYPTRDTNAPGIAPRAGDDSYDQMREDQVKAGYNVVFYPVPKANVYLLMSIREIKSGEELFVNYGNSYWEENDWLPVKNKEQEDQKKSSPNDEETNVPIKPNPKIIKSENKIPEKT